VVAIVLQILWFILTWIHNPFCCCCCCFGKKLKLDTSDDDEVFGIPGEKIKEALKLGKGILQKGSSSVKSIRSKLSSEDDEFFDPDSSEKSYASTSYSRSSGQLGVSTSYSRSSGKR